MGAQWKQKGRETSANAKGKIFNKLTARDARTIDQSRRLDAN